MPAAKRRAAVTPVPLAVWLSPPQRFALVVPRVAHGTPMNIGVPRQRPQWCRCRDLSLLVSPAIPADTLSAGRPHKTAHAPRQRLAQAGAGSAAKRLPRCRASLDFFESLTGSPQALSAAADTIMARRAIRPAFGGQASRRRRDSSKRGRRPLPPGSELLALIHTRARPSHLSFFHKAGCHPEMP